MARLVLGLYWSMALVSSVHAKCCKVDGAVSSGKGFNCPSTTQNDDERTYDCPKQIAAPPGEWPYDTFYFRPKRPQDTGTLEIPNVNYPLSILVTCDASTTVGINCDPNSPSDTKLPPGCFGPVDSQGNGIPTFEFSWTKLTGRSTLLALSDCTWYRTMILHLETWPEFNTPFGFSFWTLRKIWHAADILYRVDYVVKVRQSKIPILLNLYNIRAYYLPGSYSFTRYNF